MTDRKQRNNILQNIKNWLKKRFYGERARYSYSRWVVAIFITIIIGLITIIIGVMLSTYHTKTIQAIETIKRENMFKPVINFDLSGNINKKAPSLVEEGVKDSIFKVYGDKGFMIRWKKEEEEWLAMQWRLIRTNYVKDRYRYFLYFEGSAEKNEWIAINLIDNEKRYAQIDIELYPKIIKKVIPLINIEKYFKDVVIPGTNQTKAVSIKDFNWDSIEIVSISPMYNNKTDNKIYCLEMTLLWLDLHLVGPIK